MKDLLGIEVDENKYFEDANVEKSKETIKSKFRKIHGYKNGYQCKNCAYFCTYTQSRTWFKCSKIGLTNSSATDINKKDVACNLYKEEGI